MGEHDSSRDTGRDTLRVGSLNTWGMFADWPSRLDALRSLPVVKDVDVVLAQEVCVGRDVDQVRDLSEAFNMDHFCFHADKRVRGLEEGVAIFARERLWTIGRTNLGNGRVLIQADLPSGLTLASAHLSFEGREREEQVKTLLKRVSLDRVVLGADFNGDLATFGKALDAHWHAVPDRSPTWPVCGDEFFKREWTAFTGREVDFDLTPRRVDYILARGVPLLSSQTIPLHHDGTYVSDHAMVVSEIGYRA